MRETRELQTLVSFFFVIMKDRIKDMPTLALVPNYYKLNVIKLRIRNEDHYFIVDTGASDTHLAPTLLNNCDSIDTHSVTMMSAISIRKASVVRKKFNFCGVSISSFVVDEFLYKSNLKEDYPYSGLIGQDILRQFSRVIIDYVKDTITFEK